MSDTRKRPYPGVQIGTSFLLVVFVILCLVIFATLSLSGALRDYGYSRKTAEKTTAYYRACSAAEERIGEIDALLQDARQHTDSYAAYTQRVSEEASRQPELTAELTEGHLVLSFSEEINDSQTLEVALELNEEPQMADGCYRIVKWKETASRNWEEKTKLPVLGGGE